MSRKNDGRPSREGGGRDIMYFGVYTRLHVIYSAYEE